MSIARRLQDPLAELVKIDPKAIGVGQYQHDMPQKRLDETLGGVVEDCVNAVGVDVNTASASLLQPGVAGLNAHHRQKHRHLPGGERRLHHPAAAAEGAQAGPQGLSAVRRLPASAGEHAMCWTTPASTRRAIAAAEASADPVRLYGWRTWAPGAMSQLPAEGTEPMGEENAAAADAAWASPPCGTW